MLKDVKFFWGHGWCKNVHRLFGLWEAVEHPTIGVPNTDSSS
jgi:hypothetical protein